MMIKIDLARWVKFSPSIHLDLLANFLGRGWVALMSLAFIPIYINYLGMEAYGLVGFFGTLMSLFSVLDLGLSSTLNREIARYSAHTEKTQEIRDLVRTIEIIYWSVALLITIIIILVAPLIATYWMTAKTLPPETVQFSIMVMGVSVLFQWPLSIYAGGLMGAQRQITVNLINILAATIRSVGAVVVLKIFPTIIAFFAWQIVTSVLQTGLMSFALWKALREQAAQPARFRKELLVQVWRFAAGVSGISLITLMLTTLDRVLLSRLLTLENFGYYILAVNTASGVTMLVGPIFTAIFPRFSFLVSQGNDQALRKLYHQSCQLMSLLLLPIATTLCFFSYPVISLWTGNTHTASRIYIMVILLVIGNTLNGLMNVPYALTLAFGWTRLSIYQNTIACIILVPALIWGVRYYGAIAACVTWAILNAGYVLLTIPIMHSRLLRGELRRWYWQDVGLPFLAVFSTIILGYISYVNISRYFYLNTLLALMIVCTLGFLSATWVTPFAKLQLRTLYGKIFCNFGI